MSTPGERSPSQLRSRVFWATTPPLIRTTARLVWRMETVRGAGFPRPPFVVAANHLSFLDAPLVGAAYGGRIRFITLQDMFGNYRSIDYALDAYEVITVRRGTVPLGAMREALSHLSVGGVIGVFPEGKRELSFDPAKARPGAAWLAARSGVPLVPVAVRGTDQVLGVDNKLRRGRIRLVVGPAMTADGPGRPSVDDLARRWVDWIVSNIE